MPLPPAVLPPATSRSRTSAIFFLPLASQAVVIETQTAAVAVSDTTPTNFNDAISALEKRLIEGALATCRGHQKKAADHLGLSYHQMRGLLRKYGYGRDAAADETNSSAPGNPAITETE